ncbi:MAG: penicillin acylase family protein [Deltaproteobacteria bacterium]|nr:penicillin acylase family protein [Deltaproteobacteria bacterium]
MRWFKRFLYGFLLLAALAAVGVAALPLLNGCKKDGVLDLPGLTAPVTILRDEKGMAYIRAANLPDLFFAQGFAAAQDRLFQMHLTRLVAQGRISELVGERGKAQDFLYRTIGIRRLARQQAGILDSRTARMFQRYVDGVNAFIKERPDDLPLEFRLSGLSPEAWEVADSLSLMYYMAWTISANAANEIVNQALVERLGPARAGEIFPLCQPPERAAETPGAAALVRAGVDLGLTPGALPAPPLPPLVGVGSNNWVVSGALTPDGKPILANDTHLAASFLPGPWYPVGLAAPGCRAVGVNIPGIPGVVVGRNQHLAFGITNSYGDTQDLYLENVDPANPRRYLEGDKSYPFQVINEEVKIRDSAAPEGYRLDVLEVWLSNRGPVVNRVFPGLSTSRTVTLRWAPAETMDPNLGLLGLLSARGVEEAREALSHLSALTLNFVLADDSGHIAWQTTGRLPIRRQGPAVLPQRVEARDNWLGFIPWEAMPRLVNPPRGWAGSCNNYLAPGGFPYYYSDFASPDFRYRRLTEFLQAPGPKGLDENWTMQRDTKNLLAEELAPLMAQALRQEAGLRDLGDLLARWEYHDQLNFTAPAVFQALYRHFARQVYEDDLGPELTDLMLDGWYYWQQRLAALCRTNDSPWFDDQTTPGVRETRDDLFRRAAREARQELAGRLGNNPADWSWGKMHQLILVNPLRRTGWGRDLVGGGAHPMSGSGETLYRAQYQFAKPYQVHNFAALRMVADLADQDKVAAVLPGGVSARLFDKHMKDQIQPFMDGARLYWWFSDQAQNQHASDILQLKPAAGGR